MSTPLTDEAMEQAILKACAAGGEYNCDFRDVWRLRDADRRRIAELEAALTGIVDAMDSLHPKFVKLNQYCFTAEEIAAARAALGRTQEAQE
jgi:hypothetical protein